MLWSLREGAVARSELSALRGLQASVPFSRLLKLNRPELPWALAGCIASGLLGAQMPAFAIALSSIVTVYYVPVLFLPAGLRAAGRRAAAAFSAVVTRHEIAVGSPADLERLLGASRWDVLCCDANAVIPGSSSIPSVLPSAAHAARLL